MTTILLITVQYAAEELIPFIIVTTTSFIIIIIKLYIKHCCWVIGKIIISHEKKIREH